MSLNHLGTGNLVVLTLVLAGMMAIDMGGPFNKAAYVFASGAFANDPKSVQKPKTTPAMIEPIATAAI